MPRFLPPGRLADLTRDADLQAWSDTISGAVDGLVRPGGQFFNPVTHPRADLTPRRIPWSAVPQTVFDFSRRAPARTQVDDPANRQDRRDGQNEYSEWFTLRHPADRAVVRVDVATELGEYWGFVASALDTRRTEFRDIVRQLYPSATEADLFNAAGYDPLNPFNTTRGALHLIGEINTLPAALGVIGGGLALRTGDAGELLDIQDTIPPPSTFHADPSISVNVNRLAREGRAITVGAPGGDPFGIYIFDVDTSGWRCPDGSDPRGLLTFSRGTPPQHVRVSAEGRTFRLADVRIAGEPIRSGSQIAERTTVGIVMMVGPAGEFPLAADAETDADAVVLIVESFAAFGRNR